MKLKIQNFAKIKNAEITIDGITVIAGENNTGKSTIGKILYSVFNSLYDIDSKIELRRENEIRDITSHYMRNLYSTGENIRSHFSGRRIYEQISKDVVNEISRMDNQSLTINAYKELFINKCLQYGIKLNQEQLNDYIDSTYEPIVTRKKNDNHKIALELIERFFFQIFSSQVQCLREPESEAIVSLNIKGKENVIKFKNKKCVGWNNSYNILHEAFFIDDPFVLDDISDYTYGYVSSKGIRRQLVNKFQEVENDIMGGLFDAVNAKDNLKDIYNILNQVTQGDISLQNSQWGLKSDQFEEPVNFENLSAGLKSFVLIKMLLEKGILKEKDVLILDEPEIHLHPEWQLFYAEIIVLLQKKFDLSIIVTTHSSHFLEAIEYYSKKYDVTEKYRYYLANLTDGLASFEDVTNSVSKIYKQMVTPSVLLDKLKYEMDEADE